jgi:hypothetical protein
MQTDHELVGSGETSAPVEFEQDMSPGDDPVERIHHWLMRIVGFIVVAAVGAAGYQYGPGVVSSIRDFYHPPQHARPQPSEIMLQHVKATKFEMSPEMREFFDAKAGEYGANKRLGESYRMAAPRRP